MSHSNPKERSAEFCIGGMTCSSCELLLERKLAGVPGVKVVHVDHRTGVARIVSDADDLPSYDRLSAVITDAGYSMLAEGAVARVAPFDGRKWLEIGGSLLVILALSKLFGALDIVALAPSTSGVLSLGGVFVIGLVAGTSSCLAVTGGLLVALAAKHNELHRAETPWQKFRPLWHFNVGRLVSYFLLGGLVGVLGQSITLSPQASGYANVVVAVVMLYLALSILGLIPRGSFPIRPPKKLSRWIAGLSESRHPAAPFSLGALTFFLPCGFTQSLQIAALASGSFITGSLTMFIFALGTLPALLGLSAVSSTASGPFSRIFLRFSGTLVFLLALYNLDNGLALAGFNLPRLFSF